MCCSGSKGGKHGVWFYPVGMHYVVRKDVWIKRCEINLSFFHNHPDLLWRWWMQCAWKHWDRFNMWNGYSPKAKLTQRLLVSGGGKSLQNVGCLQCFHNAVPRILCKVCKSMWKSHIPYRFKILSWDTNINLCIDHVKHSNSYICYLFEHYKSLHFFHILYFCISCVSLNRIKKLACIMKIREVGTEFLNILHMHLRL